MCSVLFSCIVSTLYLGVLWYLITVTRNSNNDNNNNKKYVEKKSNSHICPSTHARKQHMSWYCVIDAHTFLMGLGLAGVEKVNAFCLFFSFFFFACSFCQTCICFQPHKRTSAWVVIIDLLKMVQQIFLFFDAKLTHFPKRISYRVYIGKILSQVIIWK